MSVTNYTPDNCRYWIGKLSKHVYLISENAIKDIRIDNGEAWVQSVSESPIRIDCISISLSEEESLDERYKFVHTLSFSVNGYANKDDFQGRYYVIVKDNNNTYWLVNPLFPCKVTYTYTLANEQNQTDFTIGTASNHPVLKLNGMSEGEPYQCQDYWLDGIDKIWLNEKRYSVHDGNNVKYTNDGFKVIDYNGKSATFTESFDGENTRHSIEFNVLFSDYKSSWHYNLLEIVDECIKNNNLYSAIIKTRNDKYAMCGFSFGLQPSFNISADDTTQEINRIQITLQDAHTVGDAIDILDSVNYEYLSARTWVYTDEYDGYECVGDGLAKYLLQKEVDALGNDTCNYKTLTGYESNFPELNIVGVFENIVTYPKNECRIVPCRLSTSLQRRIEFTDIGSKTYTLRAGSDWTITHADGISVTPSSGAANQDYIVTVYNSHTPTTEAWITNLKVSYCDGMEHNTVITVVEDENSCFQGGSTIRISANEQTLTISTQCCIKSVKERTGIGAITTVYSTYITVYVPANNSGDERTAILLAELCDGSATNFNIIQSNLFERWVDDHTICIGRSKYMLQYKYVGTSPDHCDTRTEETRTVLVEESSSDCIYEYRWVLSDTTECEDFDEYYLYKRQVIIIDGVEPWSDVVPAEYSIDGWGTMERVLFKKRSTNCGWVSYARYRWVDTDEGSCFEVKECDDYPQLSVPVNIRDGVIVSDDVSSVYNVDASITGRVYSTVSEILLGESLNYDIEANELVDLNTRLTITNNVTSNEYAPVARYQTLVGCNVESLYINLTKMIGLHYYSAYSFVYLLKDTPLTYYGFYGDTGSNRVIVYVPDWAVRLLRSEYIPKGSSDNPHPTYREYEHPIVLPMTDNPVPIILTEYEARSTSGYVCDGVDKYEELEILNSSGTVLSNSVKGELIERYSADCGYNPRKLTVVNSAGTESHYIDCDTGNTLTQTEVSNSISDKSVITSATVNMCVQTIGSSCFTGFQNLSNITLLGGLITIGTEAFQNCTGLTSVTIPDSVTSIGMRAFQNCTSLTNCTIGGGSIGAYAFDSCSSLSSVTIGNNVTSIGESAFYNCDSLTSVTIPDSVTSIGNYAFQYCIDLISCTIGSGVTSISRGAFDRCGSLTSVTIPDSVTTIGDEAFQYCGSLSSCTIGSGVTSIGSLVFYSCYNLGSITSSRMTAPTIQNDTFYYAKAGGTLYVPVGSTGYDVWLSKLNNWTIVEQ